MDKQCYDATPAYQTLAEKQLWEQGYDDGYTDGVNGFERSIEARELSEKIYLNGYDAGYKLGHMKVEAIRAGRMQT